MVSPGASSVSTVTGGRIAGLDGLRAFAILVVIAAHAHVSWAHGGGLGVDVFFVISGFIITYLLLGEQERFGRISIGKFWLRRALRLLPALLVVVAFVDLVAVAVSFVAENDNLARSLPATPGVLLYFANWIIVNTGGAALGWFGPLWSLSVEEQFYLLWPLVVMAAMLFRKPLRLLAILAGAGIAAASIGRFFTFDGENLYRTFGTDFRVDMLLWGVLLAVTLRAGHTRAVRDASKFAAIPAVIVLLVLCVVVPRFGVEGVEVIQLWYYRLGLPLVALSAVSIIGYMVTHQSGWLTRALSIRPLVYTGTISYGMYLWHYPVLALITAVTPDSFNKNLVLVFGLVGTYAVATLSWFVLERPLQRRFHDRLRPTQRVDVKPEPAARSV